MVAGRAVPAHWFTVAAVGDEQTDTIRCTEHEALANVGAVLQLCAGGKLRVSETTRRPSAATVRMVTEVLADGDLADSVSAFAWPLLLQAGGLAAVAGGKLTLSAKGRTALGLPAHEVIRDLWRRWPKHAPIDEFIRIEHIKGQRSAAVLTAAAPRRHTVVAALDLCAVGEWIAVDQLFRAMRSSGLHPTIARNDRALWKLHIVDPQYGSLGYDGYHDWEVLEGRYTLAVLFEYAATLGLLDVDHIDPAGARDDFRHMWGADDLDALSRYDGLLAVRLTPLGAYVTGRTDTYQPPAPAPAGLEVLANFDIVATAGLAPADRLVLDAHAVRTSDRVWTLSVASLLAAVDAGRGPAGFGAFLDTHAVRGVPATVRTLLDDVAARARQVRDLGLRQVIECADPSVAVLIASDRSLRAHCTRIGDRHLLVATGAEPKVRTALRKLGYPLGPG